MDDQFPVLKHMYIQSWTKLSFLSRFKPQIYAISDCGRFPSIGSPLLATTATRLTTLSLINIPASAYFTSSYILTRLSLMAQLERLSIRFDSSIPNHDVERQSRRTPDMITLPNLRRFVFRGTATYLEGLVTWISVPSLSILRVSLFNQLPFTVPRLTQFIQSSENLTFRAVQVTLGPLAVSLHAFPWKRANPLMLQIRCGHFDRQVASALQFFGTLSPLLSVVEKVAFSYNTPHLISAWLNNVNRSQWHELLRPFTNVKTIHLNGVLNSKIFCFLLSDDGEPPLELFPNLEEIGYFGESDARNAFTRFLNERQVSGHPVSLRLVDQSMFDAPRYLSVWALIGG
ncbi:hypothetical protein BGW80DRAFT_589741 [Lactifluus volemus]|nr:hypothetical protein BGW80DRAFT_589741 [Lactifluus volemus]